MPKYRVVVFAIAIELLIIALWTEGWVEKTNLEGLIIIALAFTLVAAYTSIADITLDSLEVGSALSYGFSILALLTTLFIFGSWSFVRSLTPGVLDPLTTIPVALSFLGGFITFYGGWLTEREVEEETIMVRKKTHIQDLIDILD